MVILYPDQVIWFNHIDDKPGEAFIHLHVGVLEAALEINQIPAAMADWPQDRVGKAKVEFFMFTLSDLKGQTRVSLFVTDWLQLGGWRFGQIGM